MLGRIVVKKLFAVAVSLAYKDFDPNIIEGQESTFTCEAKDGNPGAFMRWQVNGNPVDGGSVEQDNSTSPNTQTSYYAVTAHQDMETLCCIAEQVSNKAPIIGEIKMLNVLCMFTSHEFLFIT